MWRSWLLNFDVIFAISLCCYLTPFDLDDIVWMGVKERFGVVLFFCFSKTLSPT